MFEAFRKISNLISFLNRRQSLIERVSQYRMQHQQPLQQRTVIQL